MDFFVYGRRRNRLGRIQGRKYLAFILQEDVTGRIFSSLGVIKRLK